MSWVSVSRTSQFRTMRAITDDTDLSAVKWIDFTASMAPLEMILTKGDVSETRRRTTTVRASCVATSETIVLC